MSFLKTEDFGVEADGVANDTSAMQSAITAMNSQKLPLRVQKGEILIGNSGTVNKPIFRLEWDGCRIFSEGNTTFKNFPATAYTDAGPLFNVLANDCSIEGIKFVFQGTNANLSPFFRFIQVFDVLRFKLFNCEFTTDGTGIVRNATAGGSHVAFFTSYNVNDSKGYHVIDNCYFHDMESTAVTLDCTHCKVINNTFINVGGVYTGAHARHMVYDQAGGNIYSNNVFETSTGYAIHADMKQAGRFSDGMVIENNIFRNIFTSIVISSMTNGADGKINPNKNVGDSSIQGISISGNQFLQEGDYDILTSILLRSTWGSEGSVDKYCTASITNNQFNGKNCILSINEMFKTVVNGNAFSIGNSLYPASVNYSIQKTHRFTNNVWDFAEVHEDTDLQLTLQDGAYMDGNSFHIGGVRKFSTAYVIQVNEFSYFLNNLVELTADFDFTTLTGPAFFRKGLRSGTVEGNMFIGATLRQVMNARDEFLYIDRNKFNNNNLSSNDNGIGVVNQSFIENRDFNLT